MNNLENIIAKLRELCLQGGKEAMQHYCNLGKIITKSDQSPLTQADLAVDAIIVEGLRDAFPDIPIVTEERASNHQTGYATGKFFLVDPIDGTKEFINQNGEFTINIALIENGNPVAGVVFAPALGRLFWGAEGLGAFEEDENGNSHALELHETDNDALIIFASRSHLTPETEAFIAANKVGEIKTAGSSLKFCLIAAGEADLYPRFGPTMEWDVAAGHAVLAAAGGCVFRLDGNPIAYGQKHYRSPYFIAKTQSAEFVFAKADSS